MSLPDLSLNDDAVSDLENGAVVVNEPTALTAPVVEVTQHQTAVDHADAISKELEGYDATLTAVENGIEEHYRLNDVISTVMAAESIGQLDAERIAAVAPEFVEEVGQIREFSQAPSKTNLNKSQQWANLRGLASDQAAKASLMQFVQKDLARIREINIDFTQGLIIDVIDKYRQLRKVAQEDLQYAANSKAFYHGSDDEKDIKDFKFADFYTYESENSNWKKARAAFLPLELTRSFADAARNRDFLRLLKAASSGHGTPAVRFEAAIINPETQSPYNYIKLLGFLAAQNFDETLEDIEKGLREVHAMLAEGRVTVEESQSPLSLELETIRIVRKYVDYSIAAYASVRAADDFATLAAVIIAKLGSQLERK